MYRNEIEFETEVGLAEQKTYTRIPEQFGEDDQRGGGQVEAGTGRSDGEESHAHRILQLEAIAQLFSLLASRPAVYTDNGVLKYRWMDGWTDEWVNGWMKGWVDGWIKKWMGGWVEEWRGGGVEGWRGGGVQGGRERWMDGSMDETHLLTDGIF